MRKVWQASSGASRREEVSKTSYFIFGDYNSADDLIITRPVVRPSWAREVSEIAGGSIAKTIQLSRAYSSTSLTVTAVIRDTSAEKLKRIYSSLSGFGRLVLSSDTSVYMNAAAAVLEPVGVSQSMAELDVEFSLQPFAYAAEPTIKDVGTSLTEIVNGGTLFSAPVITLNGGGVGDAVITVNGTDFKISVTESLVGKPITIDCDNEITYYTADGKNYDINRLTYGDYPLLHIGENYAKFSGKANTVKINVKERYL